MKKLISLILAAALAVSTFAQTDSRTVLSTSTKNGVTTTLVVGRIQADPAKDGTLTITVFPAVVTTYADGSAVTPEYLDTAHSFPLTLTTEQYAGLAALVKAAYAAANPAPTSGN